MSVIDEDIFSQLLAMDDEDTPEFSKEILVQYFDQVQDTLAEMRQAMDRNDYKTVGKLGHHIKGSSAGVGAMVVREIADNIQYYEKHASESKKDVRDYLEDKISQIQPAVDEARGEMSARLGKDL